MNKANILIVEDEIIIAKNLALIIIIYINKSLFMEFR